MLVIVDISSSSLWYTIVKLYHRKPKYEKVYLHIYLEVMLPWVKIINLCRYAKKSSKNLKHHYFTIVLQTRSSHILGFPFVSKILQQHERKLVCLLKANKQYILQCMCPTWYAFMCKWIAGVELMIWCGNDDHVWKLWPDVEMVIRCGDSDQVKRWWSGVELMNWYSSVDMNIRQENDVRQGLDEV